MRLQRILAVGTAIGLIISWNQMEALSSRTLLTWLAEFFPMLGSISPESGALGIVKFLFGFLIASFFAWVFLKNTNNSKLR
jgi:hypothetical protein